MFENDETRNADRDRLRAVQSFLREGEELLWMGQPYTKAKYRPNVILIFFSIFWLGFAIFWTVMASSGGGLFGLFGLPFIAVGVYMLYAAAFGAKKTFQNTVYAVTPLRAIVIIATKHGLECRDFYFANTPSVQISALVGDCGTINLCPHLDYDPYEYRSSSRYRTGIRTGVRIGGSRFSSLPSSYNNSFEMIENVHEVYALISDCILKAGQSS